MDCASLLNPKKWRAEDERENTNTLTSPANNQENLEEDGYRITP